MSEKRLLSLIEGTKQRKNIESSFKNRFKKEAETVLSGFKDFIEILKS